MSVFMLIEYFVCSICKIRFSISFISYFYYFSYVSLEKKFDISLENLENFSLLLFFLLVEFLVLFNHAIYSSEYSQYCIFSQFVIFSQSGYIILLLFGDNKVKMARKPEKKQKENPVGCTGEGKI